MKLITITALICCTFTINGFSQDPEITEPSQSSKDIEDTVDTTIIKWGKHNIFIVENNDEESKEFDEFSECQDDDLKIHWAGVDLGVNGYMNSNNSLSLPENYKFLQLNYSKSFTISLNFWEKNISLYRDHITIVTGLGIDFNTYNFRNNTTLQSSNDSIWAYTDTLVSFQKNKLKTTNIKIPLLLGFSTNKNAEKSFHLAAGIIVGYKLMSKTKQVYKTGSERHRPKVKGNFHIAPFNYNATVRMGYGNFSIFANYALSPFFDKNKGPELYPLSMGFTLMDI